MRCGILIIGSLLWDDSKDGRRAAWRAARLDLGAQVPVRTAIYYGRKSGSRGNAYTMAFRTGEATGQAVLVRCIGKIAAIDNLIEEANALWQAEDASAKPDSLHKSWGCVGALFSPDKGHAKLSAEWTAHFQRVKTRYVSVVNANGLLDIDWPDTLEGQPADVDVILATATKPETIPPSAETVADAWIAQNGGNENYFFNNVKHGIRTSHDGKIWRRIEEESPCWLKKAEYEPAIDILRSEAASAP